ncbi:MAG: type 1 glutamine amidotransferase domain-containing protein [bacterium]|nr:type 1 glutamine amidotransferase domain-containing protein [bacterium]
MRLTGKKIVILVERDYQDLEVWYPLLRLREEGANVIPVGSGSSKEYKGKYGYPIDVSTSVGAIRADEVDAVIIPGGWAPDYLRRYPAVVAFVKEAFRKGKIVASICHGGSLLVSAGVVKGKRLTSFMAIKDDLVAAGADFVDEEVVRDGNLITSRKPEDLPAFCKSIIESLA